jgi:hemolysin D
MQLLARPSSKATDHARQDKLDPTLPAILEYQAPSAAILAMPMPRVATNITWTIASMLAVLIVLTGVIKVDKVVTAPGLVVAASPTIVIQPLEEAIVRTINVHEGDVVHAGEVLARLDPTFAASDMNGALAQVSSYQAQASRMQAELDNKPFTYSGTDPDMLLQLSAYLKRQAEYSAQLENYQQKIDSLSATIAHANSDAIGYTDRLGYAKSLEKMRKDLEQMNVGSKLNTLSAMDTRAEMERNLQGARDQIKGAQSDLAAQVAQRNQYIQNWHADVADKLTDALGKLSDARQALSKAQLRRQLVELRAERDGTVMSISKVSVGSVLQAGQQFITIVPTDAPLEIEANISGRDDGHVTVGDPVDVKFDTFNYTQYGLAHGTVRTISPASFSAQDEQRNPTGAVPMGQQQQTNEVWYRSRITLDQINLRGLPSDFHLIPGMPVSADIKVGKQTVLRYIMGKTIPLATEAMREP